MGNNTCILSISRCVCVCVVARGTSPNIPRNGQINQYSQNSSEPPPPYPIIATNVTNLIQNRQSPTQSNTTSTTGSSSNYDAHNYTGHYDSHMNFCKLKLMKTTAVPQINQRILMLFFPFP